MLDSLTGNKTDMHDKGTDNDEVDMLEFRLNCRQPNLSSLLLLLPFYQYHYYYIFYEHLYLRMNYYLLFQWLPPTTYKLYITTVHL